MHNRMINRDALTGEGVEGNEGGFYFYQGLFSNSK